MPVDYIPRIQEKYAQEGYPAYKWVVNSAPPPWQPLRRPLSASRLGLVASGGIYITGQVAFGISDSYVEALGLVTAFMYDWSRWPIPSCRTAIPPAPPGG